MAEVPGMKWVGTGHHIITPTCRANRGAGGAFTEAVERLTEAYLEALGSHPDGTFHVVLTVESSAPHNGSSTPCCPSCPTCRELRYQHPATKKERCGQLRISEQGEWVCENDAEGCPAHDREYRAPNGEWP